jgi:predicted O-linked N-acetylglucosamine transferase (SPINDLY family)
MILNNRFFWGRSKRPALFLFSFNVVKLGLMSGISFERAIAIALEQHQAGNFQRAESLYLEILRQDPGNSDAIHLLGVLANQGHRPDLAVDLIGAAIRRKPDVAIFHYNLAESLKALSRNEEAADEYRRAIELEPEYLEAMVNLADLLNQSKKYDEAARLCRKALELNPENIPGLNNLGNALRGLGREQEASQSYAAAIKINPEFINGFNNLGLCLCTLGRTDEGIEKFRQAIRLQPSLAGTHNNLGVALMTLGRFEEAGACFQTAIDIDPKVGDYHNNLGVALRALNQVHEALPCLQKAVELKPDFFRFQMNLAGALSDTLKKQEALDAVDAALKIEPSVATAWAMRGFLLRDMQKFDEANQAFDEALRLDPNHLGALTSVGYARQERGDLDGAMAALNHSIELKPDSQSFSNILMAINYHPGYSLSDLLRAHQGWAELHEAPLRERWTPHTNDRAPDRKLRVGYVSPDFRGHSVSFFLEPILQHHDHEKFEIYAYVHLAYTDMNTWRLRTRIDQWREISAKSPDLVAKQIREDQIDILIELAGHTANNALPVFARKPAPVQINMIGFPSTTGLTAMDYRITDELCDPTGVTDSLNSEKLLRMPDIFWCYQPPHTSPEVDELPAIKNGYVTFTSVNNFTKVTPHVQKLWADILRAVPGSRLIMQTTSLASESAQELVKQRFGGHGVSADRLEFRKSTDLQPYLKLLTESDMTLDPFPFNGGTTTCHSLWMGAPVVTLAGDRHASRMGLSMLTCIGLPEFIAHTPDEYVRIATRFANDLPRLRDIRAGMRQRLKNSPLLDGITYTRNLEAAYRNVWTKWCGLKDR